MPVYQYEVADRKGSVSRGTAEATEQAELITRFRERGQIVLSLRPAKAGAGGGISTFNTGPNGSAPSTSLAGGSDLRRFPSHPGSGSIPRTAAPLASLSFNCARISRYFCSITGHA